jgi:glycosyltransferase involved in cell wall biosynthesis
MVSDREIAADAREPAEQQSPAPPSVASCDPHRLSLMAFPIRGDSYTESFYSALSALGVEVRAGILAGRWLIANLRQVDYVHLHWPSFLYGAPTRRTCLYRFSIFLFFLLLCRWRRIRLVWTVHNLYPHDRCVIPQLDRLARWLLVRMAARFAIHGRSAAAEVQRTFPAVADRTVLIEHGHWVGRYPRTLSREAARSELSLREGDFVYLFVGLCKPYKNVHGLIRAFNALPGNDVLVIAGKFQDPAYEAAIRTAIDQSPKRILLHAGFIPDEKMQVYLGAANVVVAPYLEVLTSGTAMLALSFGRPVIAPRIGFLKDVVVDGCGVLYDPTAPDGLINAMVAVQTKSFNEESILTIAKTHSWEASARAFLEGLKLL